MLLAAVGASRSSNDMTGVGICIPVYDTAPEYLSAAIESVLRQERDCHIEIVVVDDCSPTDYRSVVSRYPASAVRYVRNRTNLGMVDNWNVAVRALDSEYVMLLGHDDVLLPGMIETYLQTFAENRHVVLCSCAREFIDETGHAFRPHRHVNDRAHIFCDPGIYLLPHTEVVRLCLRNGNPIGEPSAWMFRRDAFAAVGGFDNAFGHAADVDFILRIAQQGLVAYHARVFLRRRIHARSLTRFNLRSGSALRDRSLLYQRYQSLAGDESAVEGFRAYLVACALRDAGKAAVGAQWRLAVEALDVARRHWGLPPSVYLSYAREIAGRRNRDALRVSRYRCTPPGVRA